MLSAVLYESGDSIGHISTENELIASLEVKKDERSNKLQENYLCGNWLVS